MLGIGGDNSDQADSFARVSVSLRVGCANTDLPEEQRLRLQLAYQNVARLLEYEMRHRSNLVEQQLATHSAPMMMQKVSNNDAEMCLLKKLLSLETNERSFD